MRVRGLFLVLVLALVLPGSRAARAPRPDAPNPEPARILEGTAAFVVPAGDATRELVVPVVILENDYLRAALVPEAGGRIVAAWDKFSHRELLHFAGEAVSAGTGVLPATASLPDLPAGGVALIGPAEAPPNRVSRYRVSAVSDEFVSVFVRLPAPEGVEGSVEYRLASDRAALDVCVRLDNLSAQPQPARWRARARLSESTGGAFLYSPPRAGSPTEGDSFRFAGYYDDDARQGTLVVLPGDLAVQAPSPATLNLTCRQGWIAPGEHLEWSIHWYALSRSDPPIFATPLLAAFQRRTPEGIETQLCSVEFLDWLKLTLVRDGVWLFDHPLLLQPRQPKAFEFPLDRYGEDLTVRLTTWKHLYTLVHLPSLPDATVCRTPPRVELEATAPATSDAAAADWGAAMGALRKGNRAGAAARLQSLLQNPRWEAGAAYQLAALSVAAGDVRTASALITWASEARPHSLRCRQMQAYLLRRAGENDAVIAALREIDLAAPFDPFVASESLLGAYGGADVADWAREELARRIQDTTDLKRLIETYDSWGASKDAKTLRP